MFAKIFEFMAERFFDRDESQPRVGVSMKGDGAEARLALENQAQDAAADFKLVWPEGGGLFDAHLPYNLGGFEEKSVALRVENPLPASLGFVLTYRDLKGRFFCTRYRRDDGLESVEFLPYSPVKKHSPD